MQGQRVTHERRVTQNQRVTRWGPVAAVLLIAGAGVAWFAAQSRPRVPVIDRSAPESTPSRIDALPAPIVAQRVEWKRHEDYDPKGRGRLTVTVVDAATGAPLPNAWVALPLPRAPLDFEAPDDAEFDAATQFEIRGYDQNPVIVDSYWTGLFIVAGCEGGYMTTTANPFLLPTEPDLKIRIALQRPGAIEVVAKSALDGTPVPGVSMVARIAKGDIELRPLFNAMEQRVVVNEGPKRARTPVFPSLPPRDLSGTFDRGSALDLDGAMAQLRASPGAAFGSRRS